MRPKKKDKSFGSLWLLIRKYKFIVVGIIGVVFIYLGVAGMISVTTPWYIPKQNDTNRHVDYVWRIYNGDIPKYTDGVTYPPFLEKGYSSPQNAAANPPLYYLIHASVIGGYLNAGDWEKAIAIGRSINLVIGVFCILALAWAGWVYGGSRKELFAIAVPAISVTIFLFLRLNRYYALDALVILIATLNLVVLRKLLDYGLRMRYIIPLTLLSVLGMATKATYIAVLFTSLVAVVVAATLIDKKIKPINILKGSLVGGMIMGLVIISVGWFYYYWNYVASGDFFRPFNNETLDTSRPYKSLGEVMASPLLWSLFYARITQIPVISAIITSFAIAGVILSKNLQFSRLKQNRTLYWSIALLAILFIGTLATQIMHAVGYGSISFRYMFPAIFPVGIFLAYGLLEYDRLKGQAVVLAAIVMAGTTLIGVRVSPTEENLLSGVDKWGAAFPKMYQAASENGVPVLFTKALVWTFVLGAVLLSIAMYYQHKHTKANQQSRT